MSRGDLAAVTGFSESTIRAHENGQNGVKAEPAAIYARALGVTPEWLLYGTGAGNDNARQPQGAAVILHQLPNGQARLQINKVIPFALALEILAKIEGAKE